jgi:hypothetical protein
MRQGGFLYPFDIMSRHDNKLDLLISLSLVSSFTLASAMTEVEYSIAVMKDKS